MASSTLYRAERKQQRAPQEKVVSVLLALIRQEAGYTQRALAQSLGKHPSYVSKYESGELQLDMIELHEVCKALGISLGYFAGRLESKILRSVI